MLHYLLQTLAFQVLFLALYDVFHKKDTFFAWNRLYLIITPILSLVFPFIKIPALSSPTPQGYITQLERVITISSENLTVLGTTGPEQNPTNWWIILYYVGAAISLVLLIMKFYKLNILTSFSFTSNVSNKKVVSLPNSNQAFSFWNTIYLGERLNEEEKKQILVHEMVHVEQKHSLDQICFEILKIVLWWNPMIYIYQSRITVLHEYLADEAVISTIDKRNYIEQLLNATFQTQEITFVNQFFNQSLIKKRIVMLQKSKSKTIARFKYLLLIPAITGVLTYTSCSQSTSNTEEVDVVETDTQKATKRAIELAKMAENAESECPNQNSEYDKKLDNYLEITSGKNAEVILHMVSTETEKEIRTVHLTRNQIYKIRHIPEGHYRLDIEYGEEYYEKTVDGVCKALFKNEKIKETGDQILDYTTVTTEKGLNVPSYRLTVDLNDEDYDDHDH